MSNMNVHVRNFAEESALGKVSCAHKPKVDKGERAAGTAQKNGTGASVFVGESNILFADQMGQKKVDAQKEAMKRILSVFDNDLEIDQAIKDSNQHKETLSDEIGRYDEELAKIDQAQKDLKEEYGITDDSEEEENLNLLRKSFNDPLSITDEDMTKLEQMGQITDYQKSALEYDAAASVWQQLKDDAKNTYVGESQTVQGIKLARLKSDPMVGAQKAAADIMNAAIETIISLIYEKAKENLDEKFGGVSDEEAAKAKDDKADDKKADEKDEEQLDVDKLTDSATDAQKNILERLKKFIQSQNILKEDILGIKVDKMI